MGGPRLSIIPGWVITDPRLKGTKDLQVLAMLGCNANTRHGWCRRSQVKLADALGCSRSTVQAAINRLVEVGAVERFEVISASGRDSAHWYRVIYDSVVESSAFNAWDEEDRQEFDPNATFENDTTPAGIPAPPAVSGSAPPAVSGSAPINAYPLTPHAERNERERERDDEGEENPKAIEREFKRFFIGWKTAISDSEPDARRQWHQLTVDERVEASKRSADYQTAATATGRKHLCSAATYLKERRWEKLPELKIQSQTAATPEAYTAYSRAGRGLLLAELLRPVRHLQLNRIEEAVIEANPEKSDLIWRDKYEKQGWPEAARLIETTVAKKRFNVPQRIVTMAQDFDKVKVGSDIWEAWRRLHWRRYWPWLPAPDGLEWMQFPRVVAYGESEAELDDAVERAVSEFEGRLNEGRSNDAE